MSAGGYLPPPAPMEPVAPPQPGLVPDNWSIPTLSEDVAREAFKDYASSHCCYSKSPVNDGVITNMEPFNTFRYRLETFTESRQTEPAEKPFEGEEADFYTQPAPRPWEVQVTPPNLFTNHKEEIRVPYTSSIKVIVCVRVCVCVCVCVSRTNNVEDYVVEQNSGLKVDLHKVSGKELFKNNQNLLYPLIGFPNPAISEASERLIKDHQSKYAETSRILQQRQTVELIPITKVNYKWKGNSHLYFVYGNEQQVNADNYPATCCCVVQ
uniref:Protein SSUH2 homolog n=1 Tax=Cyclopterus lumpus TaxID=8103 RepID=A0A8C3AC93_CYCLU